MNNITVRLAFSAKQRVKIWELLGVSTPVRYAVVGFANDANFLQIAVHQDNIKILRLAKLRHYKKAWRISKIQGYNAKYKETVHLTLPASWRDSDSLNAQINNFLRYLLDNTWKDF